MDIIVGIAGIFVISVLLYAMFSGAISGASKKEKKPTYTRSIMPPGLAEAYTEYDYRMRDLDDGITQFEYEFDQRHNDVIAAGLFDPEKKELKLECFDHLIQYGMTLENRTEPCESRDDAREAFHNYLRGL
jgi:hypothetical protein